MNRTRPLTVLLALTLLVSWPIATTHAQDTPPAPGTTPENAPAETAPDAAPNAPAEGEARKGLKGIVIDREAGHVDLEAVVVLRDGEWLELLACTPSTREHESILTVSAKPSDIHLALLLLGLEPGKPLMWEHKPDRSVTVVPPTGPQVAVTLIYEHEGKAKTVDANQWVVNQQTGKVLAGNRWLFVGSRFEEFEGKRIYMADPNGSVLSLVNFGDEVMTRDTEVTKDNDDQAWNANTPVIPKVRTPVTIRLTPVEKPKANPDAKPEAPAGDNPQ